ncbi:MAG: HPr family phosphocarrier protein [Planctomycetota bacterium]
MEVRRTLRIVNRQGLHARPCHAIVSAALGYRSALRIRSGPREVDGKSIIELMTLSAGEGTELEFWALGADAEAMMAELERIVASGFGE